ncbi:class I adenylate-forming enzyme family protein [Streptomyces apocyni]|uniref:class I adenylate-forming enzyme family protein n=1 Tax=Streptomyces apocyni TaxID=2654677 RepID=UPI0012E9DCA4|nr:AMP-binding protein [Streptomyces apocyni]
MTSVLVEAVRQHRSSDCAVRTVDGVAASYAQLLDLVDTMAAGLTEHGVQAGQTVAFALRNSVEYVACILAVAEVGARYVPLLSNFSADDVSRALERTEPVLVVTDGSRELALESLTTVHVSALARSGTRRNRAGDTVHAGVFRMLWTSGSTGFPKAVAWRQDKFLTERLRWLADSGISRGDVFFCRHPLDVAHATDLHMFAALLSGGELVLADPGADADAEQLLQQLTEYRVTVMSALPSHYEDLVRARQRPIPVNSTTVDLSRLRLPLCGGAYLSPLLIRDAERILGIGIRQIYGSTEFGLAMGAINEPHGPEGSMVPVEGVSTRLVALSDGTDVHGTSVIGELVLRSDCTSEGYLFDQVAHEKTFRHPEFWTGDAAERLPGGAYRILGRVTEALRSLDGPLLAPVLDEEITADGTVAEVASLPMTPGGYGAAVSVVAVPSQGSSGAQAREVVAKVLARHGLRGTVHLADSLPRTPVGKTDKPRLRQLYLTVGGPR